MRGFHLVLASLLVLPVTASAGEDWYSVYRADHRNWTVSASGGFAFVGLDGDTTVDESLGDSNVSFDGALDLTEVNTFWAEVDLQLFRGKHLRAGYTPLRFDGEENLDSTLTIDGLTFNAGDRVDSDVVLDQYELAVLWDFYLTEFITVSPLVQVTLVDFSIDLSNQTVPAEVSEDQLLPVPYLGVRGEVYPLSRLSLFAEAKGMTLGSLATTFDVQGGIEFFLTRNVSLEGRYRYIDYSFDDGDATLDLGLGGGYVGTAVRF